MNESIDELKSQQGKERFVITRKTPHHKIRISHADYVALRMWMIDPDDTIVNATHRMIGQVIKCSEERHDKQIEYLRQKLNQAKMVIQIYYHKFGPVDLVAGEKKDTQ